MVTAGVRNMAFGVVNAYVILVHNKHAPKDEEWDEYVQFNRERGLEYGLPSGFLIVSDGGTPTPEQRKALHDAITPIRGKQAAGMKIAIVTQATFVQGIVRAMHTINAAFQARAFSPGDTRGACAYLQVPPSYLQE